MSKEVLTNVAEATGLPQDLITGELQTIVASAGLDPDNLTLDQLRDVLASYLQDVLLELKDSMEENDAGLVIDANTR